MLSEYEAKTLQRDAAQRRDVSTHPVLSALIVVMIVVGVGWLGTLEWADAGAPVSQAQQQA